MVTLIFRSVKKQKMMLNKFKTKQMMIVRTKVWSNWPIRVINLLKNYRKPYISRFSQKMKSCWRKCGQLKMRKRKWIYLLRIKGHSWFKNRWNIRWVVALLMRLERECRIQYYLHVVKIIHHPRTWMVSKEIIIQHPTWRNP